LVAHHVGQTGCAASLTIEVGSHEAARVGWGHAAETGNLAIIINLVALEDRELYVLLLALDLLWLGVGLLLALLASTDKGQNKMQGGLLLDVVILLAGAQLSITRPFDEPQASECIKEADCDDRGRAEAS